MIVVKSFLLLAIAVAVQAHAQNNPNGMGIRMHKRNDPTMKKRIVEAVARLERRNPRIEDILPTVSNNGDTAASDPTTTSTTATTTTSRDRPPTPTTTPTTSQHSDPSTTTTTTSQTPTTTTSTSTSTSTSTTSSTSTSTTSTSASTTSTSSTPTLTAISRTSQDTYAGITFATRTTIAPVSQTSTSDSSTDTSGTSSASSSSNKVAVAATATVAAVVILGALIFLGIWWKKKSQRGKMGEDMWDEASMKEFSHGSAMAGAPIVAPPIPARNIDLDDELGGAGLARSNTKVLPSQSAYALGGAGLARSRSQHQQDAYEEPDELLAMPPVAHYERPRDSAYDIVPAAPPTNAYASSSGQGGYPAQGYGYSTGASGSGGAYGASGGLAPPLRKGDHRSFDHLGSDPFAGTEFVDANRDSTYGPGQAGRGAGFATATAQGSVQGAGNQWPRGYNPYTGYSQGAQAPYGYGYAS